MALIFGFSGLIAACVCFLPVKIALHLRITEKIRFSSGVAVFAGKWADKMADIHAHGRKKPPLLSRWIKNAHKRSRLAACIAGLKHFYRHLHLECLSAGGTLSLADAAQTAMACGAANALSASLKNHPRFFINLRPDFSAGKSDALVRGMFSIRAGHIILAATIGIAHYIREEFAQWKNTRLKTS